MPPNVIPSNFWDELLKVLASSPLMIVTVAIACGSGHLWAYIIFSHFSKKERKILESFFGRISLGLIWFALVLIPTHYIYNGNLSFNLDSITSTLPNVIIFGLASQAIIMVIANFLFKKGGTK